MMRQKFNIQYRISIIQIIMFHLDSLKLALLALDLSVPAGACMPE